MLSLEVINIADETSQTQFLAYPRLPISESPLKSHHGFFPAPTLIRQSEISCKTARKQKLTIHFTSNFMEPYDKAKRQYLKAFNKYTIARCYYNEYRKWSGCVENKVDEINDSFSGESSDVAHLDEHSAIVHQVSVITPHGHVHVDVESPCDHHSGGNSISGTQIKHESPNEDDNHVHFAQSDHGTVAVEKETGSDKPGSLSTVPKQEDQSTGCESC